MNDHSMDLGVALGLAVAAARRGDMDGLDAQLSKLRRMQTPSVGAVGTRLRGMARAARNHPSFKAVPAVRAS